jgi:hypothetical protein
MKNPSARYSVNEQQMPMIADPHSDATDPMRTITRLFNNSSKDGISRALDWIELLQRGGYVHIFILWYKKMTLDIKILTWIFVSVAIPSTAFADLNTFLSTSHASLSDYTTFLRLLWYQVSFNIGGLPRNLVIEMVTTAQDTVQETIQQIANNGNADQVIM